MGISYQRHQDVDVYIETQKPYYNSGSSIEGTVFVRVKRNCQYDSLYIKIEGWEECKWFEGSSKNRKKQKGTQMVYCTEYAINKFENCFLQQGRYAFPFSIELSDNIPGSFYSNKSEASMQYKLIAYFANFKDNGILEFKKPLIIREPFRTDVAGYKGMVQTEADSKWGTIELMADFDSNLMFNKGNVAYEGQEIRIDVRVNNEHGKKPVKKFTVELVQYVFNTSNFGLCRTYRSVIARQVIYDSVQVGKCRAFEYPYKIPSVQYQTSISTMVANYYRIEISMDVGGDQAKVIAPIFILKLNFDVQHEQVKHQKLEDYQYHRVVCIRAADFEFKRNKALDVVNFKEEDLVRPFLKNWYAKWKYAGGEDNRLNQESDDNHEEAYSNDNRPDVHSYRSPE